MKKYLVWIGAMILVMALTSPALAQEDWAKKFTATSLFQIWSVAVNKQDFKMNAADADITTRGISSRINFYLNWGDPKYVRGVIGFEADSTNWGEPTWDNTGTTANPSGRMGVRNTDQVQLEIKHAYLDFTVPNTPVSVAVGIQGFAYGGRLFQSQDAPGMKVTAAFAPHQIQAVWWRENEGYTTDTATLSRQTYHVNDYYGLEYKLSQKEFNVYAYGFYQNNLSNATYDENGYLIGVGGGFRPGNLNLSGQLVYLTGKRDYVTGTDVDVSAYAAELLAQYTIGPGLSVAAEGFYATGNDADNATKKKQYFRPAGSESHANFGLGRTVFFWMAFSQFGNQHQKQSDFGGMYYGRLNAQYSPLPWLNLSPNYLYIGDTSKGNPANVATGGNINSPTGARQDVDKDFIGHEINVITTLKIYPNFTYNIGLGYFLPGDIYDSATKSAKNAWAVNTGMQLAF
ncbi:MAG: hypothetical protein Q7W38_01005 [Deltaproteobacteria bacterium]|nr:hypothetical protein [Deltaproteobacteria bacterium]